MRRRTSQAHMMMTHGYRWILFCFGLLLTGCSLGGLGEPSRPLHYYTLDSQEDVISEEKPGEISLVVPPFEAPGLYRETPIIWYENHHMQRFKFNRWAHPPAQMMQKFLTRLLRTSSGKKIEVVSSETLSGSDYALMGSIEKCYLTRDGSGKKWKGVIQTRLRLLKLDPEEEKSDMTIRVNSTRVRPIATWSWTGSGTAPTPSEDNEIPPTMKTLLNHLEKDLRKSGKGIAQKLKEKVN